VISGLHRPDSLLPETEDAIIGGIVSLATIRSSPFTRIVQIRVAWPAMAASARRINVTLDDQHAGKLARLAERTHVQEGTLARSLLSTALDDADPDATRITEILDAIPGAWERTQEGLAQAARGEGTPLDELA
jgi:hypothetical protein